MRLNTLQWGAEGNHEKRLASDAMEGLVEAGNVHVFSSQTYWIWICDALGRRNPSIGAAEFDTLSRAQYRDAPMTTDPNRLLKPEEAAAFLGLQPCTLAAWREDGSMPSLAFFKIGKAVRYRYGDVLAFIESRRATSTLGARQLTEKSRLRV